MLGTTTWGNDAPLLGDRVILLHGFTQSAGAWDAIACQLATTRPVTAVDLPGHGTSADVDGDLSARVEAVAAAITAGRPPRGAVVGYSLGGRYALHLALTDPEVVTRLVLVSASPGIEDPARRAERRAADELVAQRVERDGVEAFVRWWLERPMWATLPPEAAAVESRLGGSAAGLASSLRQAGAGAHEPLWHCLGELAMPVLVMAGALDRNYAAQAERMAAAIGANARLVVMEGTGHACHLEAPGLWLDAVDAFLAATEAAA